MSASRGSVASDPVDIIFTSGITGRPNGTVHVHDGFPVKAVFDAAYGMDVGPGDILFWVTDMGWMMGPWMVFGALLSGSTMLVCEGTTAHPGPGRIWQIVEYHGVSHLRYSHSVDMY